MLSRSSVTSGLDVALHLVERTLGPRISHAVETLFEHERRGTVWSNHGAAPIMAGHPQSENNADAVSVL